MLEININELRIGNIVGIANFMDFKTVSVTEIRKERVLVESKVGIYSSKNHRIVPVDISEKMFLMLGFEKSFSNDYWYSIKFGEVRPDYKKLKPEEAEIGALFNMELDMHNGGFLQFFKYFQ